MKNILSWLLSLFLVFIAGFWIADQNVLDGTMIGIALTRISHTIPFEGSKESTSTEETPVQYDGNDAENEAYRINEEPITYDVNSDEFEQRVEDLVFQKTNELRQSKGVNEVVPNEALRNGARKRAQEIVVKFEHVRPSGKDPFTVLGEENSTYPYSVVGENIAVSTIIGSPDYMAEFLFQGWLNSPDHYETMIHPDFKDLGVGAHVYNDEIYSAQLFGTQPSF